MWWQLGFALLASLLALWLVLLLVLWRLSPDELTAREALRLLPDLVRLVGRLARDGSLPLGVRIRLWLLIGYLALPIDLVPDVIPVVGYADDLLVVVLTLRSVVRPSGGAGSSTRALARHGAGLRGGLPAAGCSRGLRSAPRRPSGSLHQAHCVRGPKRTRVGFLPAAAAV